MNDLTIMVLLSLLVGAVVAGFVWFGWDLAIKMGELLERRRMTRKKKRDAAALLEQAKQAAAKEE